MGDDESSQSDEIEISPINSRAHRVPGGIWNEDELPILPWEAAEHRKVVPPSIQLWTGLGIHVVRVSIDVVRKQYGKHSDVRTWFDMFEIDDWVYGRVVVDERGRKWEIVQLIEDGSGEPWPLVTVLGEDSAGSINLVSMHRKNRRWMRNLLAGRLGFVARER